MSDVGDQPEQLVLRMEGGMLTTFDDVMGFLRDRFSRAEIVSQYYPANETMQSIKVRFALGNTCFVRITREALDRPQDLCKQLEESIEKIGPRQGVTIGLDDRSDNARYAV